MEIISITNKIGDSISSLTEKIIIWLNQQGILTTPLVSKIITIILFLLIAYLVIKFADNMKIWIKYAIAILLIVLSVIIVISFKT